MTIIPSTSMEEISVIEFNVEGQRKNGLLFGISVLSSPLGSFHAKKRAGIESNESRMKIALESKNFKNTGARNKESIGPNSCKLLLTPSAKPFRCCSNAYPKVPILKAEKDSPHIILKNNHEIKVVANA